MKLINYFRKVKKSLDSYSPLINIEVSKKNILHNLHEHQAKYPNLLFAPVLKSNAYGHGLLQVAEILSKEDIPFIVVDSVYEAKFLRNHGIKLKILIIGYSSIASVLSLNISNVAFTITSLDQLKLLAKKLNKPHQFHLKIDTGMHRQGILPEEIDEAINIIISNSQLEIEGICSHFADADNPDQEFTSKQIEIWNLAVSNFRKSLPNIKYFHIAATSGISKSSKIDANVARLGIGLYGFNKPSINKLDLLPALTMSSVITSIRNVQAGERVGYGVTYIVKKPTTIATVPAGYFEGIDRRLSNKGWYLINNVFCPIVGRVSMNISSFDITDAGRVNLEDKVLLISDKPEAKNSILNIAKTVETIPYEILVHLPIHIRRIVVQ